MTADEQARRQAIIDALDILIQPGETTMGQLADAIIAADPATQQLAELRGQLEAAWALESSSTMLERALEAKLTEARAEVDRLKKSGANLLEQKHKERREAELWFGRFQKCNTQLAQATEALQDILNLQCGRGDGAGADYIDDILEIARETIERLEGQALTEAAF